MVRKIRRTILRSMAAQTLSLKLPFLRLNAAKAAEFARLQDLNTATANGILAVPKEERGALTTVHFVHVEVGSAWMNQTIRNARAKTGVNRFKVLPLETNNQNWTLHKVGETYSLGFGLQRGVKKRIPLEVYGAHAPHALDADHNASRNVGRWVGASCPVGLEWGGGVMPASVPPGAVHDSPQAPYATDPARGRWQEGESHRL